jgi:hypothetical protein
MTEKETIPLPPPPLNPEQMLASIRKALPLAANPPADLVSKVAAAFAITGEEREALGMTITLRCGLFVDDALTQLNPPPDRSVLFRLAANVAMSVAALYARGAKRLEGEDLDPARFAIIAYEAARTQTAERWEMSTLEWTPGSLRAELEAEGVLAKEDKT